MISFLLLISLVAAKPTPPPAHRVAVSNGGELRMDRMVFAVIGNTRPGTPVLDKGRSIQGTFAAEVVGDIFANNILKPLNFLVHTGDMVSHSSGSNWAGFGEQFSALIDGSTTPETSAKRIPILPVVGDRDCAKDPSCGSFAATFPGWGADIGFGRVATWQRFNLVPGDGPTWKVLVLDSNKKGLGSRWNEQVAWLSQEAQNPEDGIILLVHEPMQSMGPSGKPTPTKELVDVIESHAPLMSIKAIFSAGPNLNQMLLPDGMFGIAQFVAGGGGAPADDLNRGIPGDGRDKGFSTGFHTAIDSLLSSYESLAEPPQSRVIDEGYGRGSFKGYERRLSAAEIPTYGWWKVTVTAERLLVTWRAIQPDKTFRDQASWQWTSADGWSESVDPKG